MCVVSGMWSGVNASVDAYAVGVWVCVCLLTVVLDVCVVCGVLFVCGVACVSLSYNDLGAEGGAAMAGAVQHLTSLTTLEYV
jgi:hypothetical protein